MLKKQVKKVNRNKWGGGRLRRPADDIFPEIHIANIVYIMQNENDVGHIIMCRTVYELTGKFFSDFISC